MGKKAQETNRRLEKRYLKSATGPKWQRQQQNNKTHPQDKEKNYMYRYRYKYMYMYTPNMIQLMSTPRKYLIPLSKSYLQSHNGSGDTKKQTKESNKTGFSPPTEKPIIVT
jgi:hypothetical protein